MGSAVPRILKAFKEGGGLLWGDHDADLFIGTERFFRPGYAAHLIGGLDSGPHRDGGEAEGGRQSGRRGLRPRGLDDHHGQGVPEREVLRLRHHAPSIEHAKKAAKEAGVGDRIAFAVASAQDFPGENYDLISFFDCLHDMGDPVGAMETRGGRWRRTAAP